MRLLLLIAAAALLSAAAVAATAPTLLNLEPRGIAAAFGNTVKAVYPDGRQQRIWLRPDGAWQAIGPRGNWSAGHWSIRNGRVCMTQSRPFPSPFRYCTDFPADGGPGVVWTSRDWQGHPISLTVVKGIEEP